jgi:cysteinyl-tRNA synthetase
VREKVGKGLPEALWPAQGLEDEIWGTISELVMNKDWKQECLRRDEKFDMHLSSAVRVDD